MALFVKLQSKIGGEDLRQHRCFGRSPELDGKPSALFEGADAYGNQRPLIADG